MKKIHFTLLILPLLPALVASCKKDKDKDKPAPVSARTEMLTAHTWETIAITVNPAIDTGSGSPVTDIYATRDTCQQDDITRYMLDKSLTYEEGATKCDVNDPQVYDAGTWEFNAGETQLIEKPTLAATRIYSIAELSRDKMILTTKQVINSIEYTFTATFIAQ